MFGVGHQSDTDMPHLTDTIVKNLPVPTTQKKTLTADGDTKREKGLRRFFAQVTRDGARSFVIRYNIHRVERLYTIGRWPDWPTAAAREEARRLLQLVDQGIDPKQRRDDARDALTVNELCERYLAEHAIKKRTGKDDGAMIVRFVKPQFGNRKAADVAYADIDQLHRRVTKENGSYQANRLVALLSKMFNLAIRWELRGDNPVKGIERNHEEQRHRYLSPAEIARLCAALAVHSNQSVADAVRLALFTGARRGEVLGATWQQFDFDNGVWTKPSSHTKQKREHIVPLSAPALELLTRMKGEATGPYLFPARNGCAGGHLTEIKKSWAALCKAAGIEGVRLHDLRHSFASVLVSSGASLELIGSLLGHSQVSTSKRYSHLYDDAQRAAVERVGQLITGNGTGDIVPLRRRP
jgi:integrase